MSRAGKKKGEMSGNSLGVLSSGALAGAERSGGERSEPQRSGAAAKAGADSVLASRPDPEVVAKPKRRAFTAEYKLGILQEAEAAAATRGGIGVLLRREGLYSSLLATWRRERANGILEALTPQKRGPKSKRHPMDEENQKLRRQNARLAEDLRKAHIIIDVQKEVAALLGNPIPKPDPRPRGEILMAAGGELVDRRRGRRKRRANDQPKRPRHRRRGREPRARAEPGPSHLHRRDELLHRRWNGNGRRQRREGRSLWQVQTKNKTGK